MGGWKFVEDGDLEMNNDGGDFRQIAFWMEKKIYNSLIDKF